MSFVFHRITIFALLFLFTGLLIVHAQNSSLQGRVLDDKGKGIRNAAVFIDGTRVGAMSDNGGNYNLKQLRVGQQVITSTAFGYESIVKTVMIHPGANVVDFRLQLLSDTLQEVMVDAKGEKSDIGRLQSIEGTAIYEGKKTELINVDNLNANLATMNQRQVFAKVPGLNIWESDQAGLQLGIGARGLSPNRSANFNIRQNGYDISADALGYPESYYTPPIEALDRIEIVRGAASLQYGTQFGGMVNFRFRTGPKDKKAQIVSRQSVGSFGLFNTFNSVGGQVKKLNYYAYYNYKIGDGWRPNSAFNLHSAYLSVAYDFTDKLNIRAEYTHLSYDAQQPGGLTDALFLEDPQQSIRERNHFRVRWNPVALIADYQFSPRTRLNVRNFALIASRDALGFLGPISRPDPVYTDAANAQRTLISDEYRNWGNETRLLHRYTLIDDNFSALLIGMRYYRGYSTKLQGDADNGFDANYHFLNPEKLEGSDFYFPSTNFAAFAENIFSLTDKLSITPGLRYEYIRTSSEGYFRQINRDVAGNIILDATIPEERDRERSFVLLGAGLSYRARKYAELYANFSQNFRGISFTDLRVDNPNLTIDQDLQDESGYNADLGFRGAMENLFNYDISVFLLHYNDRIGQYYPIGSSSLYRTNISDSRHYGLEAFGELQLLRLIDLKKSDWNFSIFGNITLMDAQYVNADNQVFEDKEVEFVAKSIVRAGASVRYKTAKLSLQHSYTSRQYTDATNAISTPTATNGLVPSYTVADLSASYVWGRFKFETGINNIMDNYYFTRRATSYPGPGVIPASPRNLYFTLQVTF